MTSDPDIRAVRASYIAALESYAPALAAPGSQLLDRVTTPNWTLEWYLPRWLGSALGLDRQAWRSLMHGNVCGLVYVRQQDDIADGEAAQDRTESSAVLATTLFHCWLTQYRLLFSSDSPFWGRLHEYLAEWARATLASNRPGELDYDALGPEALRRLAHRGAPLKACCAGACLLAGRERLVPQLDRAMDLLLAGTVMLDHALDWPADLDAGRYNVFVAHTSHLSQTIDNREAVKRRVLEAVCMDLAASDQAANGQVVGSYFKIAQEQVSAAGDLLHPLQSAHLDAYLSWLETEIAACGRQLVQNARDRLGVAVKQLIGAS